MMYLSQELSIKLILLFFITNFINANVPHLRIHTINSFEVIVKTVDFKCHQSVDENNGKIILSIIGGNPPYSILIKKENSFLDSVTVHDTDTNYFFNIFSGGTYYVYVSDNESINSFETMVDILEPEKLRIDSFKVFSQSCPEVEDGEIELFVSGGTFPYKVNFKSENSSLEFMSSSIIDSLNYGKYEVFVLDRFGCSSEVKLIELPPPPKLKIDFFDLQPTSCATGTCDGKVSARAFFQNGEDQRFNYSWDNGKQDILSTISINEQLCKGYIKLIARTDQGCSVEDSIEVTTPEPISINLEIKNGSCYGSNDGSISAKVNGGTPPYHYKWGHSNIELESVQGLQPGIYNVTASDSKNCQRTSQVLLKEPKEIKLTIDSSLTKDLNCFESSDGIIAINVEYDSDEGNPLKENPFKWSNYPNETNRSIFNFLASDDYSITVTDINGCSDSIQVFFDSAF